MKIAMLAWESLHSFAIGGGAVAVTELAAGLERKGHEVHVFTRQAHGQRYYDRIDGVHYHRCSYPPHDDFVEEINNMCRAFVDRVFTVEDMEGSFDLIHAHDWLAANAMIWIKQGRNRPGIFQVHSTEYARCGNSFPGGRAARVREQERAATWWADRVICVSEATKREVMWMYEVPEDKVSVLYNGVASGRFLREVDPARVKADLGIGSTEPIVFFCGRLEWQKGPDLLIEAIPQILASSPRVRFLIAGDGGMRGDLERRVRELGIKDTVRFLGMRFSDDLVSYYKACDLVCVPSRNEPFGIVVLEAWSAGKPVVVTNIGGPNEFVEHAFNGLKISPDPNSVTWGVTTMLGDMDKARRMGENGRRAVGERYSWDHVAANALAIYGRVLPREASAKVDDSPAGAGTPKRSTGLRATRNVGKKAKSSRDGDSDRKSATA